jgi:carboxyl-terminal processing protease
MHYARSALAGFLLAAAMAASWTLAHAREAAPAAALDREKVFDAVVSRIEEKFFDGAKLRELKWGERAAAAKPEVLAAPSDADAVRRINDLLGELKTSHTALIMPDDYTYYFLLDVFGGGAADRTDLLARNFWGSGPFYPGIGAFTREVGGKHFVSAVFEGSPAERAGLRYGDEIVSIDGEAYTPVAAFRGKIGRTVALEVRRAADAPPQRLDIAVVPMRPREAMANAMAASARVIERGGKRFGYVHVWGILDADGFKQALAKIEPSDNDEAGPLDGLVVDVRGRVGGGMRVVEQMLEALDGRGQPYWGATRFSEKPLRGRDREDRTTRAGNPPFRGRSILLIDAGTRSAGEILAQGFRRGGFGPIVGTTTAGAVSAASAFVVPGDLLLYVAVTGLAFDGKALEGAGVTPDHRVERPLAYAGGADPVLEAALDLLVKGTAR